jgi:hypothetical protein
MASPDQENFEALQRLLTLKRYEQPPPGFYAQFADRVRARIEAVEEPRPAPTLWSRLFGGLQLRPVLAGACAVAAGAIVVWKLGIEAQSTPAMPPALAGTPAVAPGPKRLEPMPVLAPDAALTAGTDASFTGTPSSFRPMLSSRPPSFLFRPGAGMATAPRSAVPRGAGAVPVLVEVAAPAGVSTGSASGLNPGASGESAAGSPR